MADLTVASRALETQWGLASLEGGRHPGWGTANRIVPLGGTYLELVTVVDRAEAAGNAFGRWVASMLGGGSPLGWAVRTDDLDAVAARLGLTVAAGSRRTEAGQQLRWHIAGVEQAAAECSLPFFIEWDEDSTRPGQAEVSHPAGLVSLAGLVVTGDGGRLTGWLGGQSVPVDVQPGPAALTRVRLASARGELVLEDGDRVHDLP